jgi:monoamine oxidase
MTVGIVGLGASGLRAAMLLERAGIDLRLFEARGRAGGRLYTADEGDGCVFEAGAEWFDADHYRVIGLLHELGLDPIPTSGWPQKLVFRGKECTEATVWNDALEDDLRVEAAAREMCRNLNLPPWSNVQAGDLDPKSLGDFLREHTQTDRGLWWVNAKVRSERGEDPDQLGLLGWLAGYLRYLDREGDVATASRFPGGAGQLVAQAVGSLQTAISYNRVLTRVRQDEEGVTLVFEDGETRVDRVILTLPPPVLERIVFEPALSVAKRCAIEACRMNRLIKISWQFDRPWWHDLAWGGAMLCDTALQRTWDGSIGDAHVLNALITGEEAMRWRQLGDPVRAGIYELSTLFPMAASSFVRGWITDWVSDPFTQGGYSTMPKGYVLEHMPHIATPEGRIHFAGEHTAVQPGLVESALESAERVVSELNQTNL